MMNLAGAATVWRLMRWFSALALPASLGAGCTSGADSPSTPVQATSAPAIQRAEEDPGVTLAARVWRLGPDAIERPDQSGLIRDDDGRPFTGIDVRTLWFLGYPSLRPAVQFSCTGTDHPYEDALVAALESGSPAMRLQALTVLMRVRAPSSVPLQWRTLQALDVPDASPGTRALPEALRLEFSPDWLLPAIAAPPPADRYADDRRLAWAIRAAGATRLHAALRRLRTLSRGENLDASLAAEASLEEFEGAAGDEALVDCLLGWQYDAYARAGYALLKRNPELLRATLRSASAPAKDRYQQALLLAKLEDPAAVPILCETVEKIAVVDDEMFDAIARLARREHLSSVEALPTHVREEQREQAEAVRTAVRARLAAAPVAPK